MSTMEDTPSSPVAIGASDPEGEPLTYSLKQNDLPQKGSVSFANGVSPILRMPMPAVQTPSPS